MNALVKELKDAVQDWEWYPSTSEMMTCVKNHLESDTDSQYINGFGERSTKKLDCTGCKYAVKESIVCSLPTLTPCPKGKIIWKSL